jgi:TetR/AcrR family transcriptional repressor of nem operon
MIDKRQQIIEIATKIVHSKGYESTSIQDILQAAQIGKGQFYYYFSSKQELGVAIIDYYFKIWHQLIVKNILEANKDPKVKIEEMLDFALQLHREDGCKSGCFFGNLALELSEHNELIREKLNQVFELWINHLTVILDEITQHEDLPIKTANQNLAQVIVSMIEGGILLMKNRQDIQALFNVADVIRKLVNIHYSINPI